MQSIILAILMMITVMAHAVDSTHGLGGVIDGNRYEVSWVQGKDVTAIIRVVRFGDKMDATQYSTSNGVTSILDAGTPMIVGAFKIYHSNGSRMLDAKEAEELKQLLKAEKIDSAKVSEIIKGMIRG